MTTPTPNKRKGYGYTLSVDLNNAVGSSVWTLLAGVVDGFTGPGAKADFADTTTLDDFASTFEKTGVEPGEFDFDIVFDPSSETQTTDILADLLTSEDPAYWQLTSYSKTTAQGTSAGTSINFHAYVSEFNPSFKRKELVKAQIKLKLTGPVFNDF